MARLASEGHVPSFTLGGSQRNGDAVSRSTIRSISPPAKRRRTEHGYTSPQAVEPAQPAKPFSLKFSEPKLKVVPEGYKNALNPLQSSSDPPVGSTSRISAGSNGAMLRASLTSRSPALLDEVPIETITISKRPSRHAPLTPDPSLNGTISFSKTRGLQTLPKELGESKCRNCDFKISSQQLVLPCYKCKKYLHNACRMFSKLEGDHLYCVRCVKKETKKLERDSDRQSSKRSLVDLQQHELQRIPEIRLSHDNERYHDESPKGDDDDESQQSDSRTMSAGVAQPISSMDLGGHGIISKERTSTVPLAASAARRSRESLLRDGHPRPRGNAFATPTFPRSSSNVTARGSLKSKSPSVDVRTEGSGSMDLSDVEFNQSSIVLTSTPWIMQNHQAGSGMSVLETTEVDRDLHTEIEVTVVPTAADSGSNADNNEVEPLRQPQVPAEAPISNPEKTMQPSSSGAAATSSPVSAKSNERRLPPGAKLKTKTMHMVQEAQENGNITESSVMQSLIQVKPAGIKEWIQECNCAHLEHPFRSNDKNKALNYAEQIWSVFEKLPWELTGSQIKPKRIHVKLLRRLASLKRILHHYESAADLLEELIAYIKGLNVPADADKTITLRSKDVESFVTAIETAASKRQDEIAAASIAQQAEPVAAPRRSPEVFAKETQDTAGLKESMQSMTSHPTEAPKASRGPVKKAARKSAVTVSVSPDPTSGEDEQDGAIHAREREKEGKSISRPLDKYHEPESAYEAIVRQSRSSSIPRGSQTTLVQHRRQALLALWQNSKCWPRHGGLQLEQALDHYHGQFRKMHMRLGSDVSTVGSLALESTQLMDMVTSLQYQLLTLACESCCPGICNSHGPLAATTVSFWSDFPKRTEFKNSAATLVRVLSHQLTEYEAMTTISGSQWLSSEQGQEFVGKGLNWIEASELLLAEAKKAIENSSQPEKDSMTRVTRMVSPEHEGLSSQEQDEPKLASIIASPQLKKLKDDGIAPQGFQRDHELTIRDKVPIASEVLAYADEGVVREIGDSQSEHEPDIEADASSITPQHVRFSTEKVSAATDTDKQAHDRPRDSGNWNTTPGLHPQDSDTRDSTIRSPNILSIPTLAGDLDLNAQLSSSAGSLDILDFFQDEAAQMSSSSPVIPWAGRSPSLAAHRDRQESSRPKEHSKTRSVELPLRRNVTEAAGTGLSQAAPDAEDDSHQALSKPRLRRSTFQNRSACPPVETSAVQSQLTDGRSPKSPHVGSAVDPIRTSELSTFLTLDGTARLTAKEAVFLILKHIPSLEGKRVNQFPKLNAKEISARMQELFPEGGNSLRRISSNIAAQCSLWSNKHVLQKEIGLDTSGHSRTLYTANLAAEFWKTEEAKALEERARIQFFENPQMTPQRHGLSPGKPTTKMIKQLGEIIAPAESVTRRNEDEDITPAQSRPTNARTSVKAARKRPPYPSSLLGTHGSGSTTEPQMATRIEVTRLQPESDVEMEEGSATSRANSPAMSMARQDGSPMQNGPLLWFDDPLDIMLDGPKVRGDSATQLNVFEMQRQRCEKETVNNPELSARMSFQVKNLFAHWPELDPKNLKAEVDVEEKIKQIKQRPNRRQQVYCLPHRAHPASTSFNHSKPQQHQNHSDSDGLPSRSSRAAKPKPRFRHESSILYAEDVDVTDTFVAPQELPAVKVSSWKEAFGIPEGKLVPGFYKDSVTRKDRLVWQPPASERGRKRNYFKIVLPVD